MSATYTITETFTRTHASYLASKVGSDLKQMQLFYGDPNDAKIIEYLEELKILLLEGCLESIIYGYKRGNDWVVAKKYSANFSSIYSTDDRSGGITPGKDISGAVWGSYLNTNSKFDALSSEEKNRIEQLLPIKRTSGIEPRGNWISDRNYYSGGTSLERSALQA